jgi:NADH:ubiquinone oxidoreductase subunit D
MAAELVDRLAILVAVRRFPGMGVANSWSLRSDSYVRMQFVELLRSSNYLCSTFPTSFVELLMFLSVFWGDVRREFIQHLYAALHGTLGS